MAEMDIYHPLPSRPRPDPGFFLEGGAPLRNDVTDRWGKQILKASTKKKASSRDGGGGVSTPCTLP